MTTKNKKYNCSCNCKHWVKRDVKLDTFTYKSEFYCDIHPERFDEYHEKYADKTVNWLIENVSYDCYEPSETQKDLNGMKELMYELKDRLNK